MAYASIIFAVTLAGLIIAAFTDFKVREVPDWLSYGLIASGLGLNLAFSFIYSDFWISVNSLAGLVLAFIIALLMFYSGQWGGGDSKVLMGLGALIGFDVRITSFPFMAAFMVNLLLVGALYGLIWSLALAALNWNKFSMAFMEISHSPKMRNFRICLLAFVFLVLALFLFTRGTIFSLLFIALLMAAVLTFYLLIFIKAIERTSMLKEITPDRLTEGDWIAKDIKYRGKYICGPKDLGVGKDKIIELKRLYGQHKIKKVLIKEGIPFVPSFLIAYALTWAFGNFLFFLV
ncbi:A24 family peptidase [Candidatus Woesearchaeota archaeon]|nr:A24 family peptidase [Candidatus Woesearchaeota archaeon]